MDQDQEITKGFLTNNGFIGINENEFITESKKLEGILIYNFENKKAAFYDYKNSVILPGHYKTKEALKRIYLGLFNETINL